MMVSQIAFVSAVFPEFSELSPEESDEKNKAKSDEIEANPVKAKVFAKFSIATGTAMWKIVVSICLSAMQMVPTVAMSPQVIVMLMRLQPLLASVMTLRFQPMTRISFSRLLRQRLDLGAPTTICAALISPRRAKNGRH
jgi:hypothetical protein